MSELLGICFWREGFEGAFGPERTGEKGGFGGRALKAHLDRSGRGRKGVAGERGAEMVVWFGGCGDFGRKSP